MDIKNIQKSKEIRTSRLSRSSKASTEKRKSSLSKSNNTKENKNVINRSEKKVKYSFGVLDKIVEQKNILITAQDKQI